MMGIFDKTRRFLRRFSRSESGNTTIEFVLVFPGLLILLLGGYESGMLTLRQVMLERGVDLAARDVRIGAIAEPTHDALKEVICANAGIIPNCASELRLEMVLRDPRSWVDLPSEPDCVNREELGLAAREFTNGGNNELLILRACALFDPMLPTSALGIAIPKKSLGAYALVATSAFVMEPFGL